MQNIKNYLEIVLITYNRAEYLRSTLLALAESPFSECHITILNNLSTDNTLEICNSFINRFSNLTIITNKVNIGGNANILRAVETSNGKYTWILCDDDEYDFSYCDDLIDAIIDEKAELIHVGGHTDVPWNFGGRLDTPRNLVNDGYSFFRFSGFVPCNIFKTSSFYPYIISGYANIANSYPHMPFLISFFDNNKNIYITKNRIVKATIGNQPLSYRDFYMCWLNTSFLLNNKKDRITMFLNPFHLNNKIKKILFPLPVLNALICYNIPISKHLYLFGSLTFILSLIFLPFYFIFFKIKTLLKT
jgi:GT2 family glycosyltransferase